MSPCAASAPCVKCFNLCGNGNVTLKDILSILYLFMFQFRTDVTTDGCCCTDTVKQHICVYLYFLRYF